MRSVEERAIIRAAARAYEQALPSEQRKRLGQFFSGTRLGKLLAHLALHPKTRSVLDPMAGHGDLLDASWEAATESTIELEQLDGIEICKSTAAACRTRLAQVTSDGKAPALEIIAADAFNPRTIAALKLPAYDLVITNPPYVRYQSRNPGQAPEDNTRSSISAIARELFLGNDRHLWVSLVEAYSGLADLSVPAWLLSAMMVNPGGRLALVVPATWRSRNYADVIQYLMLRCFSLEFIVEDKQPGWFSDALVRTHLIVARRLHADEAAKPLGARATWPSTLWVQVAPEAADEHSLVGAAFGGECPERQFAAWMRDGCRNSTTGISVRSFDLVHEWASLVARIKRRRWYHQLEPGGDGLPLFAEGRSHSAVVPAALRDILPDGFSGSGLATLEEAGIHVGQGLRTGCNFFFYVTACGPSSPGDMLCVEASSFFNRCRFSVPSDVLRPVLRRQSEMPSLEGMQIPDGRVLDLRQWVVPEDADVVMQARAAYAACGETPPQTMPDELANYVRMAATARLPGADESKRIPELSAVRTNVRISRDGRIIPRFWYMLPDFGPRHQPAAFVPRVNHGLAWVERNHNPGILIDANFSTFWSPDNNWSRYALKALLNSAWCRALMEALGTPLGGGALKLEATHLRRMPIPVLSNAAKVELDKAGRHLARNTVDIQSQIDDIILNAIVSGFAARAPLHQLAKAITDRAHDLSSARQRAA